jgi:hypothetical protein
VKPVPYGAWGEAFVAAAVTPARVRHAVAGLAGDTVDIGPLRAGPGDVAEVQATGKVRTIDVESRPGDDLAFTATLTIDLDLDIRATGHHHFTGTVQVPLGLVVRTAVDPVVLIIDVERVRTRDITAKLHTEGLRSRIIQRIGNVDGEVRKNVARVVNERADSEAAREARTIDVLAYVDGHWPED